MVRDETIDVLVVGAGPVGMLTALLLARAGLSVRIIDQESRTASRTYACALHPSTLQLLDRLGLVQDVFAAGHKVSSVAWYEGSSPKAQVDLSQLPAAFPFVVVLPQSSFEGLLQERLKTDTNVAVEWTHRLSGLQSDSNGVSATIDKLGVSAKGYIVPEMEWSVEKTLQWRASYVIGADGPNSFVAESLGLGVETGREPEFYAVYEIQSDWDVRDQLRIVLEDGLTSVLWPLPGKKFRWSFQLREEHLKEFPAKDRQALEIDDPVLAKENRAFVEALISRRAPWLKGGIQSIGWSTDVEFGNRVARRFGQGRCWLAGDAAHQTGPAGMQSMNQGLLEADQLASALIGILRQKGAAELLEAYDQSGQDTWRRLLGLQSAPKPRSGTSAWVREHADRILPCLPASGPDLKQLLAQLQLD